MKKEVKNWLDSARYDLETAEHMLNTSRYIYTIKEILRYAQNDSGSGLCVS